MGRESDNFSTERSRLTRTGDVTINNTITSSDDIESNQEHARSERYLSEHGRKTVIGCVIVVLLSLSWVGAQQFAQAAVRLHSFDAPYFATWFSTCWMLLCFPGYLVFVVVTERNRARILHQVKESKNIFGRHPVTTLEFFKIIVTLNIIWLGVNYLYIYGLKFIAASDASAIMVSNVAFVYILSLILLGERLYVMRVAASVLCIAGVILFGYAEGFKGSENMVVGVAMVIASAFGAAVYKVVFKRVIGEGTLGQVSMFLTLLAVANITIMWTVNIFLHVAEVESFSSSDIPWKDIILSSILGLVFNFLVNFGIAFTYPLFISISMMVGVPVNVGIDALFHGEIFTPIRIIAALLVFAGFVLTLLPDSWNDPIHAMIQCKTNAEENVTPEEGDLLGESPALNDNTESSE